MEENHPNLDIHKDQQENIIVKMGCIRLLLSDMNCWGDLTKPSYFRYS